MEILTKPMGLASSSDTDNYGGTNNYDMNRSLDSNLVDIENKLKALNMDFLKKYNTVDKTDSSETLFGPGGELDRFDFAAFRYGGTPLKYHRTSKNWARDLEQLLSNRSTAEIKPKGSLALGSGNEVNKMKLVKKFSFGQMASYSNCPSEYEFNTRIVDGFGGALYDTAKLPHSAKTFRGSCELYSAAIQGRQRSLSFTGRAESSPTAVGEGASATATLLHLSTSALRPSTTSTPTTTASVVRPQLVRKSKSFKARTLRRLSYNPGMVVGENSSSSSGSELEVSALSECDIRTTGRSNRKRGVLPRGSRVGHGHKLYGSSASIQSAPHFDDRYFPGTAARRNQVELSQQLSARACSPLKSVFSFEHLAEGTVGAEFKWPEQIDGSTVKRNDLFWNQSQALTRHVDSSSSSSGNAGSYPGVVRRGLFARE